MKLTQVSASAVSHLSWRQIQRNKLSFNYLFDHSFRNLAPQHFEPEPIFAPASLASKEEIKSVKSLISKGRFTEEAQRQPSHSQGNE